MLADLCGADRGPEEDPRFEVNYHLFSTKHYSRAAAESSSERRRLPTLRTVTTIWRTADWHERETFDMFGVIFDGHPDLRQDLAAVGF